MPEIKWQHPEDIQSRLVAHLVVPFSAETIAVMILSCTAVSQKNCRWFLFFATSLTQGWRRAYLVEKTGMKLTLEFVAQR